MAVSKVSDADFEAEVLKANGPVVVDFWACLLYTSDAADE